MEIQRWRPRDRPPARPPVTRRSHGGEPRSGRRSRRRLHTGREHQHTRLRAVVRHAHQSSARACCAERAHGGHPVRPRLWMIALRHAGALQWRFRHLVLAMSTGVPGGSSPAHAAGAPGIEVERKFLLPGDPDSLEALRGRIVDRGGTLLKKITFEDSYFDSPSYSLTLADHWLRQRDGAWELKVPGQHVGGTAVYTELETEAEIAGALAQQLKVPGPASLGDLLSQHSIEPCATFGTTRESFSLPGGYHIDLDMSSFGYGVGEIEVMCAEASEVEKAAERIGLLGSELGVVMATKKGELQSKVSASLLSNRPAHHAALKEAGVL